MPRYLIALGSSHPNGHDYIYRAFASCSQHFIIHGKSRIYKNSATKTIYNCIFYNAVIAMHAQLHPHVLYRELTRIELMLGRIRTYKNARRTIDIDVLMSLDFNYTSSVFFLPHQEALTRVFFVVPAIEAIKSSGWPIPTIMVKARTKFGKEYLCPLS